MTVRVRPRKGGWQVDIYTLLPNGKRVRDRRQAPVASKTAALRWGEARERELLFKPQEPAKRKEVPKLAEFSERFLEGYAKANRQKPSGIAAKETILRVHLVPHLGEQRLDRIGNEDVQRLKAKLAEKAPKTVNNVLTVLSTLLRVAVEWGVIEQMPCRVRLLRLPRRDFVPFYDFDEYARLVEVATAMGREALLVVLLGGDAGLRCGEIIALEWPDVDFPKRQLRIQRSEWKGQVTSPKGGRSRCVPMTRRLAEVLRDHRHVRSARVVCTDSKPGLSQKMVRGLACRAGQRAGLPKVGVHILRHTFCSHLAMRGAPARAIQELAGHVDLSTTQRYMHLSPAAVEAAIRLLEEPNPAQNFGTSLSPAKVGSSK